MNDEIETLRRELNATVAALIQARGENRDEVVYYLVKVPAQRGWRRWKKDTYLTLPEAMTAANTAANFHSKARVIQRRSLIRETMVETVTAPKDAHD